MTEVTTRDELISSGLDIVRESGLTTVLPDFTVRELIDRADGATRSAFQHAWPLRSDFERDVLEDVLAARALAAPVSLTNVPRAIDLIDTGPDLRQFIRLAYLNADGADQRRDHRDRVAVTCLASGSGELADFARQSETARQAKADELLVQVLRICGVAFGLEPVEGFTFLDLARCLGSLNAGMLMHRIARPDGKFTDFTLEDTPGWSLESVCSHALVRQMTRPLGTEHAVPLSRKPHPSGASRPAADVPSPQRPPTTRSVLLAAGVEIANERGLFCALPGFTVSDLLDRVSSQVTEGAFHHSWPRKVDFENELLAELATPDVKHYAAIAQALQAEPNFDRYSIEQILHKTAANTLARPFDPTFMYLETLVDSGSVGPAALESMRQHFVDRSDTLVDGFRTLGEFSGRRPVDGLEWEQLAWIAMAITDGIQLRLITEPSINETSLEQIDPVTQPTLLGHAFCAIYNKPHRSHLIPRPATVAIGE